MKPMILEKLISYSRPLWRFARHQGWKLLSLSVLAIFLLPFNPVRAGSVPTTSVISVDMDKTVILQMYNFPSYQLFTVTMGVIGTRGAGGTVVATTDSGVGGSFSATYNIPDNLKGLDRIAIRLESSQGFYAYDWFYNNTTSGNWSAWASAPSDSGSTTYYYGYSSTSNPTAVYTSYSGYPSTTINTVVRDTSVTLTTHNLPPYQLFTVRMGPWGTRGVNGTVVATTDSLAGGSLTLTYNIPDNLKGSQKIAIRLESSQGYYAFDWFYNVTNTSAALTATAGPTPTKTRTPTYGPSPTRTLTPRGTSPSYYLSVTPTPTRTFTPIATTTPYSRPIPNTNINSVVKDTSVTLTTYHFPAHQIFTVRMGAWGTQGINGTVVGTTDSGSGGSFQVTYTIPDSLKGSEKIAIRLESPQGYFAYDWFYNK